VVFIFVLRKLFSSCIFPYFILCMCRFEKGEKKDLEDLSKPNYRFFLQHFWCIFTRLVRVSLPCPENRLYFFFTGSLFSRYLQFYESMWEWFLCLLLFQIHSLESAYLLVHLIRHRYCRVWRIVICKWEVSGFTSGHNYDLLLFSFQQWDFSLLVLRKHERIQ
jgi:hypothetical protein